MDRPLYDRFLNKLKAIAGKLFLISVSLCMAVILIGTGVEIFRSDQGFESPGQFATFFCFLVISILIIIIGAKGILDEFRDLSPRKQEIDRAGMERLLSTLETLGFYRYAPARRMAEYRNEALQTGNIFIGDELNRGWLADAEDLAEGGVKSFLMEETLNQFLSSISVKIESIDEQFVEGGGYKINLNGKEYQIYSEQELKSTHPWVLASVRTMDILNELLANAQINERFYSVYAGGEDQAFVF